MTAMSTHRYYPSPSSSSVDRMSLDFIAPGAPTTQSFANPATANAQPPSWSSVNVSSLSIRMDYNSGPGRVDSHRGSPEEHDDCDTNGGNQVVVYAAPKQAYSPDEKLVVMYLYIMQERPWKEAVQLYNRWKRVQSRGSTAKICLRTEGGLQSEAYRLEKSWGMTKTREDRDAGRRNRGNRSIFMSKVRDMHRQDLYDSLEMIFGPPKDVAIDRYGYRR
ncbi:hypothetical protein BU16DRAFT_537589 [Lophium mytilinum]|uniref:Uncharacterized protein n=1 Tax=Lophium mytilinum TaxID=390894 RepID=A0A6A6R2F0_9PEZI|nr:hypothetical protein BU16DRAFT_537589 [Lophium mytilinum]